MERNGREMLLLEDSNKKVSKDHVFGVLFDACFKRFAVVGGYALVPSGCAM